MDAPPASTLLAGFERAVREFAGRPCLEIMGRTWSYAEVGALVACAAGGLRARGVRRGDRVGLCLPNSMHAVAGYYAVLWAGGVVVNFNPLAPAADLAAQARDSGLTIIFTTDLKPVLAKVLAARDAGAVGGVIICRFTDNLPATKRMLMRLFKRKLLAPIAAGSVEWSDLVASAPIPATGDALLAEPRDLAVLQYTGGTTGAPKGVMLTHHNLAVNAAQVRAWFAHSVPGQERVLAVLPLFHVFAMTVAMNAALGWGAEIVLLPKFEIASFLQAMRRRRPTIIAGVPTLYKAILDLGATPADLGSVRACISGGAPLPHELRREFEAAAGCHLVEGYGLTEASPVCFCNPIGGGRDGTIGLPLPGVEAEIRGLDDPARREPDGTAGELCLRGPNVMAGYWQNEAATETAYTADGWLRTGDVGIQDADGYVELVDRIKDLILCSGFNVYPRRIEEALYLHAGVVAATAVGEPDGYRGESVAAFVQLAPGSDATPASLLLFLADKLSPIEMPRRLELRADLPRTAIGKLSRNELRAELLGEPAPRHPEQAR